MTHGYDLAAQALRDVGVKDFFFILGGPMGDVYRRLHELGARGIDVRHEQAGAMMAHAYSRVTGQPGVAMGCSGPGTMNLLTGVATAWADGAPLVAIGGSSPTFQDGMGAFQEFDQAAVFAPVTKWSFRVTDPARIPDAIEEAFQRARGGRPGPVYLDLPADILYATVADQPKGEADKGDRSFKVPVREARPPRLDRPAAEITLVEEAARVLAAAERPMILSGTGIIWSQAWAELRELVDVVGAPFYTTPLGRGVIPEDHPLALLGARSSAWREADVVLVVGTRLNHMIGYGRPPRFSPDARFIQIDIDQEQLGHNRHVDVALLGDAKTVLRQLVDTVTPMVEGRVTPSTWVSSLTERSQEREARQEARLDNNQRPIHPLRLAREIRDFIDPDTILAVDGQEILTFCRQVIPSYRPAHRLNPGPLGTMGVGLPFGIGAKVARPDQQVVVVHGDGSFGMNGMELDTAVRHNIPLICVISNNSGWTADRPGPLRLGRDLRWTRYDLLAESLGAYGQLVEDPEDIRPALEKAKASGRPSVINVVTDPTAKSSQAQFSVHEPD